jgi:multidrug efflux pump subunit AcrB
MPLQQLDQYVDLNIAQRISMLSGVGQVVIFGEQKYAPTVQVNPEALAARGLGMDDVATAISNNTVEQPVGTLQGGLGRPTRSGPMANCCKPSH